MFKKFSILFLMCCFMSNFLYAQTDILQHMSSKNLDQLLKSYKQQTKKQLKKSSIATKSYLIFLMPLLFLSIYYAPALLDMLKSYLVSIIKDLNLEVDKDFFADKIAEMEKGRTLIEKGQKNLEDQFSNFEKNTEKENTDFKKKIKKENAELEEKVEKSLKESKKIAENSNERIDNTEKLIAGLSQKFNYYGPMSFGFGFGQHQKPTDNNKLMNFITNPYVFCTIGGLIALLITVWTNKKIAEAVGNGLYTVGTWFGLVNNKTLEKIEGTREALEEFKQETRTELNVHKNDIKETQEEQKKTNLNLDVVKQDVKNCENHTEAIAKSQDELFKQISLENQDGTCYKIQQKTEENIEKLAELQNDTKTNKENLEKNTKDQEIIRDDLANLRKFFEALSRLIPIDNANGEQKILEATNIINQFENGMQEIELIKKNYEDFRVLIPKIKNIFEIMQKNNIDSILNDSLNQLENKNNDNQNTDIQINSQQQNNNNISIPTNFQTNDKTNILSNNNLSSNTNTNQTNNNIIKKKEKKPKKDSSEVNNDGNFPNNSTNLTPPKMKIFDNNNNSNLYKTLGSQLY